MENSLGILSDPVVFEHNNGSNVYKVEVIQQSCIDYQFNYFINSSNVEFVVSGMINTWSEPVKNFHFSFFNYETAAIGAENYLELSGFEVFITLLDGREIKDKEKDVVNYKDFLNQKKA